MANQCRYVAIYVAIATYGTICYINIIAFTCLMILLQWYISTITIPKSVLLIIHLTDNNMKSLMKLTSLLLVETLSDSDYVMVYVSNKICTDNLVPANSSRQLIEICIATKLDITSVRINSSTVCQEFHR